MSRRESSISKFVDYILYCYQIQEADEWKDCYTNSLDVKHRKANRFKLLNIIDALNIDYAVKNTAKFIYNSCETLQVTRQ